MATCTPNQGGTIIAPVNFSTDPLASFGATTGQSVAGTTTNGSVEISDVGQEILRGDCNNDETVDAADISAVVLEIFDGDNTSPNDTPGGTYPGTFKCDANEDVSVDAADVACTVLIIFDGQGACETQ